MFMVKICRISKPNFGAFVRFFDSMSNKSRETYGRRGNPNKMRRSNSMLLKEAATKKNLIIEPLTDRELLRVHGDDVVPFLQGLITNDMSHLKSGHSSSTSASMYTMFLNKGGRVLYDAIMYRTLDPNTYLIECDKEVANDLRRHLRTYRVRRKIQIDSASVEYRPWIVFNPNLTNTGERISPNRVAPEIFTSVDPRISALGVRLITTPDKNWKDLSRLFSKIDEVSVSAPTTAENYRTHRYRFGVGEGINDIPPGKSFPFEANADFLHGVSFQKGCYVGQELTARVHHTGVIRKRLMPVRLTVAHPQKNGIVQTQAGANVGTLRGVSYNRALALLRVEPVLNSPKQELMIDGEVCYAEKPKWWPADAARDRMRD